MILFAFVLLTVGLLSPTARAEAVPNLTGAWINPEDSSAPAWQLHASFPAFPGSHLTAAWHGGPGPHASLVGSFDGTLNQGGTAYTGPMQVSEGGLPPVGGTMTFTIVSPNELSVTYQQDNGVGGTFTLKEMTTRPKVDQSANPPGVTLKFDCLIGDAVLRQCDGAVSAYNATPIQHRVITHRATIAARQKRALVGNVHFSVPAGQTRKIRAPLNKAGRKLLSKFGRLRVVVKLSLNPSSGLPPATKLGTVTFHKKKH